MIVVVTRGGRSIGILTAGGDSPDPNAAIRGIGKAAIRARDMNLIGFRDGFRGLVQAMDDYIAIDARVKRKNQ